MARSKTPISLVVTDMDGTFLTTNQRLLNENIKKIDILKDQGIPVIFCTGRPIPFVIKYLQQTNILPIVIGNNGAVVQNVITGEYIATSWFEKDLLKELLSFCQKESLDCLAYTVEGIIYFSKESKRIQVFIDYNNSIDSKKTPLIKLLPLEHNVKTVGNSKICKILITKKNPQDLEKVVKFLTNCTNVYAVSSMENVIDIMPQNVSKGTAIENLAQYLHIPLKKIGVIGDNKNDISMFEKVRFSVCMANGNQEAKNGASYVTKKTNDEAGFAEAIDWLLNYNNME